jgi:hypothetical protein
MRFVQQMGEIELPHFSLLAIYSISGQHRVETDRPIFTIYKSNDGALG